MLFYQQIKADIITCHGKKGGGLELISWETQSENLHHVSC